MRTIFISYILKKIDNIFLINNKKQATMPDENTKEEQSKNGIVSINEAVNQEEDSDGEDYEIKITLKPQRPWSSYTQEELDELEKKYGECDYCYSLRLPEHMYKGHYWDKCPRLKKMRCDRCAVYGHTGGHCPTATKKLEIKCTFCFRGGKQESKYNSHTIECCVDKKIYDGDRYEYQGGESNNYSSARQVDYRYSYDNTKRTSYSQPERVQNVSNKYQKVPEKKSADSSIPSYNQRSFSTNTHDFPPLSKK